MRGVARFVQRRCFAQLSAYQHLWVQGRPREGLLVLRGELERTPSVELRKELLDMLVGLEEFEEGVRTADEILASESCADTYFLRGECRERTGRIVEARTDYEAALHINSKHVGSLRRLARLLEPERGLQLLSRALDAVDEDEDEKADLLCERGVLNTHVKRFDDAMTDFARALVANERCAPAYHAKGDVLLIQHDYHRALHNYQRFWDMHATYYNRVNSSKGDGDALLLDVCVKRAACYSGLQDWEMVEHASNTALDLARAHVSSSVASRFTALATYYAGRAAEGKGHFDVALDRYGAAIKGNVRAAMLQRSALNRKLGRHQEADADATQLDQLMKRNHKSD